MTLPANRETEVRALLSAPWRLAHAVRVSTIDGPVPMRLFPKQREVLELALAYRECTVLKARQLGVSWALALLALWDMLAHETGLTLVVSIGQDESSAFVAKVKFLHTSMPEWMQKLFPIDTDNTDELSVEHGKHTYHVKAISSSGSAGRSYTAKRVIGDEAAWWKNRAERMTALRPAYADGGHFIEVSTANGYDDFRDKYLTGIDVPALPITDRSKQDLSGGHARLFIGALERPGRTLEWVQAERRKADLENPGRGAQEYPLDAMEAFVTSGSCDFDVPSLVWYMDSYCTDPPWRGELEQARDTVKAERADTGRWVAWEAPVQGRTYLIGGDFSGGGASADATYLAVYDAESMDQVAAFYGHPNPDQAAREMMKAGRLYKSPTGPSLLIPEANNHGQAVVAILVHDGYPRIYEPEAYNIARGGTRAGKSKGWLMNERSKHTAIGALQEGVRERVIGIRDRQVINEMLTFFDGEALEGKHDDRVIATSLVAAVSKYSLRAKPRTDRPRVSRYWQPRDRIAGY